MRSLLDQAMRDPWTALRLVLGDPLHPGGMAATEALLDRAKVTGGTRLVDLGCGAGGALEAARARGALVVGLDQAPAGAGPAVCGTLTSLPLAGGRFDVVVSECTLCLSEDLDQALAEVHRVLDTGGRLALSDVTLEEPLEHVPGRVAEVLCLDGARPRLQLRARIQEAGFTVVDTRDHREDLLAMRDRLRGRLDVDGLLASLGSRGAQLQAAADEIEAAVEDGRLGYVSLVARRR